MRFIRWFLRLFNPPTRADIPRVKFVEGTEWTCLVCDAVLAVATRDIYGSNTVSAGWDRRPVRTHCGLMTIRRGQTGRHEIHTPTGWVG